MRGEPVRLSQELGSLIDGHDLDFRRKRRDRGLLAQHLHLLDLAADLAEAEPFRERPRSFVLDDERHFVHIALRVRDELAE